MKIENTKARDLTRISVMSSLVFVATYLFKVPTVSGYTHLGDSMIFLSVLILGSKKGALAGGIGAALSDFLGGYMYWVLPSFIIKIGMGLIMGLFAEKIFPELRFGWLIGAIVGGIFQVAVYTLVKIPLLGFAYAIATVPVIAIQTISNIVAGSVLILLLLSSGTLGKLKEG